MPLSNNGAHARQEFRTFMVARLVLHDREQMLSVKLCRQAAVLIPRVRVRAS